MKNSIAIFTLIISSSAFAGFLDDLWDSSAELVESVTGVDISEPEEGEENKATTDSNEDIGKAEQSDVAIIDHRTANKELTDPEIEIKRTKGIMSFQASLDEMGPAFNCKNARESYGRISVFNTKMTKSAAHCIAERSIAPESFNDYLSQMTYINEWSYLTVVTGEYINQLDQATRQLFGSEFDWNEITKINPYCDQFKGVVSEVRQKRTKPKTNFSKIFDSIPNQYLTSMFEQLTERKADELVKGKKIKYPIESYSLVELLSLHKIVSKKVSNAQYTKSVACKREVGSVRSCDYAYFDKKISTAKKELKNIERNIRARESQYPYLAQSYKHAKSVTDIGNLMNFYNIHEGRDNLSKLKDRYKALKAQGLSEQSLQTQMKGALAPSIAAKKKEYKNFLAATCSANIPISQTNKVGMPWSALTSANSILDKVEKAHPQFKGYSNCLRNAAKERERIHGTAAMAGAALCFGSAVGLGMASAGTATMIVSPLCGAAFFGLDATPKIESSKALASSISCQQLLGKETCSDEEREKIEDLDWWATFGTTATVAGEVVGIGMDAFTYGSKAVRAMRRLPSSSKQASVIDTVYQFNDFYKQQALVDELGKVDYQRAIDFMDSIQARPEAKRFFYPNTSKEKRISIIKEYLKSTGGDPSQAESFLANIDKVLKIKGESLEQAVQVASRANPEVILFKKESEIAYDLSNTRYFEQLGDEAKLAFLKDKYPHASEQQIKLIKKQLDSYFGNAEDPQGLLELVKVIDEKDADQLRELFDPDKMQTAISRARSLGFEGSDIDLRDAIIAERISALWSINEAPNVSPKLKRTIMNIINDPETQEDIIALNNRACK